MGKLVKTDYEEIGNSFYCIYCAGKIKPQEHYHDGGNEGNTYECDCQGAHETVNIKDEIGKLQNHLKQLQISAQSKLNKHRYDEAVEKAASKFRQPILK